MRKRATIYTVAKIANVSIASVSRIINGQFRGDEETRENVLRAMEEVDYRPNREARRLMGKKTGTGMVGVMAPFFIHPFFVEVLKGAYRVISAYSFSFKRMFSIKSPSSMSSSITRLMIFFFIIFVSTSYRRML